MVNSRYIYGLFSKAGIKDKELQQDIIAQFTLSRTTHTSEMKDQEAEQLCDYLQNITADPGDKIRKKMIHYAHLLGWKTYDGKIDITALNNWCVNYGQFHKALNEHSIEELTKLLSQFEKVFKSYLNTV